jgi:hypothetical protein
MKFTMQQISNFVGGRYTLKTPTAQGHGGLINEGSRAALKTKSGKKPLQEQFRNFVI